MEKKIRLGKFAGLEVYARKNVFVGFFILWGAFSGLAYFALKLTPLASLGMGVAGVYLHYTFEFWHQYCHAWAARRTGYPMDGLLYTMVIAISIQEMNLSCLLRFTSGALLAVRRAIWRWGFLGE